MTFIIFFFFLKKFEKVEKTGIISTKFSLWCTPSVILGVYSQSSDPFQRICRWMIIITWARLQRATVKLDTVNQVRFLYVQLQGLGSSQLADHLVNEINQGPYYVKIIRLLHESVLPIVSHQPPFDLFLLGFLVRWFTKFPSKKETRRRETNASASLAQHYR